MIKSVPDLPYLVLIETASIECARDAADKYGIELFSPSKTERVKAPTVIFKYKFNVIAWACMEGTYLQRAKPLEKWFTESENNDFVGIRLIDYFRLQHYRSIEIYERFLLNAWGSKLID